MAGPASKRGPRRRGRRRRKAKKKWIAGAIKRPGAFTRWCKRRGYAKVTAECIREGMRSQNPRVRRQASLARTLRKMSSRRRARRKTGRR